MLLRHNSLFPNPVTTKLLLQSRLLEKIIKELQGIVIDGGSYITPF